MDKGPVTIGFPLPRILQDFIKDPGTFQKVVVCLDAEPARSIHFLDEVDNPAEFLRRIVGSDVEHQDACGQGQPPGHGCPRNLGVLVLLV